MPNQFYLEFLIGDHERFARLQRFFQAIKQEKERQVKKFLSQEVNEDEEPWQKSKWQDYLDDEALKWFSDIFDLESEEGQIYSQLWELTAPEIRLFHPMFNLPGHWDLESMLYAIFTGEYILVALVQEKVNKARLYYSPQAIPFGGTECLIELLKSFGNQVVFDSYDERPPEPYQIEWNYELARRLVKRGEGFGG